MEPRPFAFAIGVGLVPCATSIAVHAHLAGFARGDGLAPGIAAGAWVFGGSFLLGAVPGFVSARYGVRSPPLVAIGAYVAALATSWSTMVDAARSAGAGVAPTPFEFVVSLWVVPLAVALLLGAVEYRLRNAAGG